MGWKMGWEGKVMICYQETAIIKILLLKMNEKSQLTNLILINPLNLYF